MMERVSAHSFRHHRSQGALFRTEGITAKHPQKVKWRFKPRLLAMLVVWGLLLFSVGRLVAIPLVAGVCQYWAKTRELATLQQRSQTLTKQLAVLRQTQKYMQTDAYVEEKGHQIGMIKENETQMIVVDPETIKHYAETKKAGEEFYGD
jgi:cell division protein FtsB